MSDPVLFGADYSVYTRIARLALQEKGVAYRLEPVDIFAPEGVPPGYLERHPFGKIPAFEHDGFRLYESGAIARYVDEAFPGPPLQPNGARQRARLQQTVSVLDHYAYRTLVWDIFVERVRGPQHGRIPDEQRIAAALPRAEMCLRALTDLLGAQPFFAGTEVTLADLHAGPMLAYFHMAAEGATLLNRLDALRTWWERMAARPSLLATRYPLERGTEA